MSSEQQRSTTPAEDRDRWRTPPFVFWWADRAWGPHFVDLAADTLNALCPVRLTQSDDALRTEWSRLDLPEPFRNGWCNPPYSKRAPWFEKAAREHAQGFLSTWLVPAPNGEDYWSHVFGRAREIVFIKGRLSYLTPNGEPVQGNRFGSVLVRYDCAVTQTTCRHVERDVMLAEYREAIGDANGQSY